MFHPVYLLKVRWTTYTLIMRFSFRAASVAVLSVTAWSIAIPHKHACNGHADLCNRSYGNITYAGGVFYQEIKSLPQLS
jgi:hypothetical protein